MSMVCLANRNSITKIFAEPDLLFDSYLHPSASVDGASVASSIKDEPTASSPSANGSGWHSTPPANAISSASFSTDKLKETAAPPVIVTPEETAGVSAVPEPGAILMTSDVTKSLIFFLATRQNQPLWNYEDITAKVWSIRSAEQINVLLQHVFRIFQESLPNAHISERWAQTALQLGLSCSSRHYAGRSLQIYRALRVPITSRMLSDILSRLIETVAEQGEDMQG